MALKNIDKTEEVILGIHKATGATGKKLEAMYLIYASLFTEAIGDKKKSDHFDKRLAEFNASLVK